MNNHNFTNGQILFDTHCLEIFYFDSQRDGFKASAGAFFRVATNEEAESLKASGKDCIKAKLKNND